MRNDTVGRMKVATLFRDEFRNASRVREKNLYFSNCITADTFSYWKTDIDTECVAKAIEGKYCYT